MSQTRKAIVDKNTAVVGLNTNHPIGSLVAKNDDFFSRKFEYYILAAQSSLLQVHEFGRKIKTSKPTFFISRRIISLTATIALNQLD